jgi:KTSC domain
MEEHVFGPGHNIAKIVYQSNLEIADVWFQKGPPYRHFGIPPKLAADWTSSPHPSSFHYHNIRGKFPTLRLECSKCQLPVDPSLLVVEESADQKKVAFHANCHATLHGVQPIPE